MSSRVASRRWALAVRLTVVALVWSVGLILAGLFVPVYGSDVSSPTNGLTLTSSTLLADKGVGAMVLVTIPALVSVIVLVAIRRRRQDRVAAAGRVAWVAISALTLESLLGILSIGAFMVPVAILLALAVRLAPAAGPHRPVSGSEADAGQSRTAYS